MGGRDEATERVKGASKGRVGWIPVSAVDVHTAFSRNPDSPETTRNRSRSNSLVKEPFSAPSSPAVPHITISSNTRDSPPSLIATPRDSPISLLKQKLEPSRNKSDPASSNTAHHSNHSSPDLNSLSPTSSPLLPSTKVFNRFRFEKFFSFFF